MPRDRSSGHYYFGILAALGRLFGGELERIFRDACKSEDAFAKLARGPVAMAIGLASKNVTGRAQYNNETYLLTSGRRNLTFNDSEEHLGGSALTALLVLSRLCDDAHPEMTRSLVSAIGVAQDANAQEILKGCASAGIDTDAVSQNQESSWHSTVLVHTSQAAGASYDGQRIFLDRGYRKRVTLDQIQVEQMIAQIKNPNLRVLYCDKFLAQHPLFNREEIIDEENLGPLLNKITLDTVQNAITARPDIDILYETGGGGSQFGHVEARLRHIINIFTSGFPFFANAILAEDYSKLPAIGCFSHGSWWNSSFDQEVAAIDEFMSEIISVDPHCSEKVVGFKPPEGMLVKAAYYAEREQASRRWFIATLHHRGAIGLDIKSRRGWFSPAPVIKEVKNTSGAGDSFRGALMYSLIQEKDDDIVSLPAALSFSTAVASERCRHFALKVALTAIHDEFSGARYAKNRSEISDLIKNRTDT